MHAARVPVAVLAVLLLALAAAASSASAASTLVTAGSQARVSQVGPDGNTAFRAWDPAVAFSSKSGQYLVVWQSDDDADEDHDIYGRFVAADGQTVGGEFRITSTGGPNTPAAVAATPRVAYNVVDDEFLVVFAANRSGVAGDLEIFAQRVGPTGDLRGGVIGVSDMAYGNASYNGHHPQVVHNPKRNQYLIVWFGRDDAVSNDRNEVWGRRIGGSSAPFNGAQVRVSNMPGGSGWPVPAYNSVDDEYLVSYIALPNPTGTQAIYAQRFTADLAAVNDQVHVSAGAPNTHKSSVTYNPDDNEYLVAWSAVPSGEVEIFAQRVSAAGIRVGPEGIRVSDMGPDGAPAYGRLGPGGDTVDVHTGYSPQNGQYLVAWPGDDNVGGLVDDEWEMLGQSLGRSGEHLASNFTISEMGPLGSSAFGVVHRETGTGPIAYDSQTGSWLLAWPADDETAPLADNEIEIFSRRVTAAPPPQPVAPPPPPPPPAPPAPVDLKPILAPIQGAWSAKRRSTRVLRLTVLSVPAGGSVEVLCRGKGCPFKRRKFAVRRGRASLGKALKRRPLRVGTRLEVRITAPGHLGKVVRYTIRKKRGPLSRLLCLPPGAPAPRAC